MTLPSHDRVVALTLFHEAKKFLLQTFLMGPKLKESVMPRCFSGGSKNCRLNAFVYFKLQSIGLKEREGDQEPQDSAPLDLPLWSCEQANRFRQALTSSRR